jgi:hypothetical protein
MSVFFTGECFIVAFLGKPAWSVFGTLHIDKFADQKSRRVQGHTAPEGNVQRRSEQRRLLPAHAIYSESK